MSTEPNLTPPKIDRADHGHATVRSGLGTIPFAGQAAVEIFNALLTPPIEKRRNHWMQSVASAIQELQKKENTLVERLQGDETFQSILLQASWAAVRNHQAEKLTALRTAVKNAAVASNETQLLFVRYIDELTPTHLVVMNFFVTHEKDVAHIASYTDLHACFVNTSGNDVEKMFFKLVCEDLNQRGLLRISAQVADYPGLYDVDILTTDEISDLPHVVVSELGRAFTAFVMTNPLEATP